MSLIEWVRRKLGRAPIASDHLVVCIVCGSSALSWLAPAAYHCQACGHEGGDGLGDYKEAQRQAKLAALTPSERRELARETLQDAWLRLLATDLEWQPPRFTSEDEDRYLLADLPPLIDELHAVERLIDEAAGLLGDAKLAADLRVDTAFAMVSHERPDVQRSALRDHGRVLAGVLRPMLEQAGG